MPQPLLGGEPDGEDALAAVDPREQESLQLPLSGGDVGSRGEDPAGIGAGPFEEGPADVFGGTDGEGLDRAPRPGDEPGDLEVDQLEEDGTPQIDADDPPVALVNPLGRRGDQRQLEELLQRHQAELDGVIGVVRVVGDRVGGIDHLRLEDRRSATAVLAARRLPVEHLAGEIQAGETRIAAFEELHDPQRLGVVIEAPLVGEQLVENILAGVPQRGMADVVGHRQGLDEILVEGQRSGERAGDARHLEGVGQPAAVVVAVVAGEDLRLVGEAAEGSGVEDPVPIALVGAAEGMGLLVVNAPPGVGRVHRPGGEDHRLPRRPVGGPRAGGRSRSIGHGRWGSSPRSWCQRASSDWGSTLTPATEGMKFTSPGQRGTTCQWRCPGTPAPATAPTFSPMLKPWASILVSIRRHHATRSSWRSRSCPRSRSASVARWSSGATRRWPLA